MPIYEYRCAKCGEFEFMQRITDAPLARCPTCRNRVTKLISNTSFQLKGSGWYATDYGRTASNKSTDTSESKESTADSKATSDTSSSATKSDSKSPMKPSGSQAAAA